MCDGCVPMSGPWFGVIAPYPQTYVPPQPLPPAYNYCPHCGQPVHRCVPAGPPWTVTCGSNVDQIVLNGN